VVRQALQAPTVRPCLFFRVTRIALQHQSTPTLIYDFTTLLFTFFYIILFSTT
jgi:hypothetical protein